MARFVATILAGFAIASAGYYALHVVDFSEAGSDSAADSREPVAMSTDLPTPASGKSQPIRVCLAGGAVSSLELKIDGPFLLKPLGGGNQNPLERGKSLGNCRVACEGQTIRIGDRSYPATRLEIVPEKSPALWVNGHQYRGSVRVYRQPGGKLLAVNVLPLEDYIASVIDSEMPSAFPKAARLAQAICSRTYAISQMKHSRSHPYFDVYSSTRSQNYLGYQYRSEGRLVAGETAEGRRIAEETAGLVCVYKGDVFCTYYSAVCGGRTTRGDLVFRDAAAPLRSVSCDDCRDAPLYRWTEKHTRRTATRKLASLLGGSQHLVTVISRADNRPLTPASLFLARTAGNSASISAVELRRRFSLPSCTFQVWQDSGHFLFEGQGHGHGVGLCQWGARGQALAGKSAVEILGYYYPGCEVDRLPR